MPLRGQMILAFVLSHCNVVICVKSLLFVLSHGYVQLFVLSLCYVQLFVLSHGYVQLFVLSHCCLC